ncbi:MAG: transcription termination factor NusA, partial [Terriglobales bacterium]
THEELQAEFDKNTGEVRVYALRLVVEEVANAPREISLEEARKLDPAAAVGMDLRIPKAIEGLGRIAAQTAKQIIFQKVREAERDTIYDEYIQRKGEVANVIVKRVEGPDTIVDLGRVEARLPRREQSRLEAFAPNERIRVVIKDVDKVIKGPQVLVSRADSLLVQRLFESEVPEIYDGTVVIKAVAREPGERTKIAVYSRDKDVDCVGACVGMKGMRVQSIIRELRGEKIDIIEFSEDPVQFAANALSPAKISRVAILDSETRQLEVVVDDTQLSLAIGKKGQNVRLAAKLLGWKIDIKSEEEKRREVEQQMAVLMTDTPAAETPLAEMAGLDDGLRQALANAGIGTVEQLGGMTPEQLQEIPGIGPEGIEQIFVAVNQFFGATLEAAETAAPAGAEGGDAAEPQGDSEDRGEPPLQPAPEGELERTMQDLEAEQQRGVLDTPAADAQHDAADAVRRTLAEDKKEDETGGSRTL